MIIFNISIIFFIIITIFLGAYIIWRLNIKKLQTYNSSLLGKITVFEKYNQERLLTINGFSQGISLHSKSVKKSYWYEIAKEVIFICKSRKKPKILVLGLGGNTTSLLIQKEIPESIFTIIEIDKNIVQACEDWFYLNSLKNLKLIVSDAYKEIYNEEGIKSPFDAIVVDIFNGKKTVIKTREKKIMNQFLKLLKPKGILIFNWPANTEKTKQEAKKITDFYKEKKLKVSKKFIKDPRRYKNFVITVTSY